MRSFKIILLSFFFIIPVTTDAAAGYFLQSLSGTENADTAAYISPFFEENENCFLCHGQDQYEYTNQNSGRTLRETMCAERVIERDQFYSSNHKSFSCTDCHSYGYSEFPHPGELRMEESFNCIDCHGGDDMFSQFNFEQIEADYQKSVHFPLEEEGYSCWKCHDPHEYRISIRNTTNLGMTISYDNDICLNCHSDFNRYKLLTSKEEVNLIEKHDWLPNQASHFRSVRCIECHSSINDSVLVSHQINPSDIAVKKCNECHSQNSMLMESLYKFQSKEQRRDGFLNAVILNQSYVIGATRNRYLNNISFLVFILLGAAIAAHVGVRIFIKKKK